MPRDGQSAELRQRRKAQSTEPLVDFEDDDALPSPPDSDDEDGVYETECADGHLTEGIPDQNVLGKPLIEHLANGVFWTLSLSPLFILLDVMTHRQYGDDTSARLEIQRLLNFLPAFFVVVFATLRWPAHLATRFFLFFSSAIGGSYMIHLANVSSYLQVMRRCPALGTLWIWAVIQMDLLPTVVSLACVAAFVWLRDLKIVF